MRFRQNTSLHVVIASVATALVSLVATKSTGETLVIVFVLGCSVSTFRTTRHHGGETRRLIRYLGVLGILAIAGFIVRGVHGELVGTEQPFPSPADLLHLPAYVLFFLVTLKVARARQARSDGDAWLDAVAPVVGVFMILWISFIGDFVTYDELTIATRALNMTYTTIIFGCMVVLLRIMATPGHRPTSYYLLGLAAGSYVVADLAATYSLSSGKGVSFTLALSPIAFGFLLASVKHPSIVELLDKTNEDELRLNNLRMATLAFTMTAPASILIFGPSLSMAHEVVFLVAGGVLATVVVLRVLRLLRRQQRVNDLEGLLSREVATLASLDSAEQIQDELPTAVQHLIPTGTRLGVEPNGMLSPLAIAIPSVSDTERQSVPFWVDLDNMAPEVRRVVEAIVREAGLLADSAEGIAATAKQQSLAETNRLIAEKERRFRSLVQHASDIIAVVDHHGQITYVSDAMFTVLGVRSEDAVDTNMAQYIHPSDLRASQRLLRSLVEDGKQKYAELRSRHVDGSTLLFEVVFTDMRDVPAVNGIVLNISDVTDRRRLERDLKNAETTDPLTLQLNRSAFIGELEVALRRTDVSGIPLSLAIIDLNDFKTVNDSLGPILADQALVECADRIRRTVRINDIVARLSGDEFGLLMPDGYSSVETVAVVERVLDAIREPFTLERRPVRLSATGGIAMNAGEDIPALELLRRADTALSIAKTTANGQALLFQEEMGREVNERLELRNGFANAIENDELRLVYQPIVSVSTGHIRSLEALARWTHPTLGPVSPSVFIPIAEESDQIHAVGEWALRSACEQIVAWDRAGISGFTVSVNMSGYQLRDDETVDKVAAILEETGVKPNRLVIEITESVLIDDSDFTRRRIAALRALGLSLAIDDFGTGYSSLSYLQRYDFDILKIDKAFVEQLANAENIREREIVRSIINLARGLSAVTVAEGIETHAEYKVLQNLGCDNGQGYLFYRPLEVSVVTAELVARTEADSTAAA